MLDVKLTENQVDVLEINLSGYAGTEVPLVDIYVNGELYSENLRVTSNATQGEINTFLLKGDFSEAESLSIQFKNDAGIERVDIKSILFNGNEINLDQGVLVRTNGDEYQGQTKMYWNSEFKLDADALKANEYSNFSNIYEPVYVDVPGLQVVEIDLTGVRGDTIPEANFYINGELVKAGYKVTSQMQKGQSETVRLEVDGSKVTSVQVEFINDDGPSRIDILHLRVNNSEVDLQDSVLTRTNGDVHEGLTKIYWNGSLSADIPDEFNEMITVEMPAPTPSKEADAVNEPDANVEAKTPVEDNAAVEKPASEEGAAEAPAAEIPVSEDVATEAPVAEIPALEEESAPVQNGSVWDGVDVNKYRGDYAGRDRANFDSDAEEGTVLNIKTGTSAQEIMKMIAAADASEHLTLNFEAGEHWFSQQLLIERGDITVKGAGEGKTVFVADFADGNVQNLIQIQGDDIRLDAGSNNGRWRADQSDYVGTATKNFALGDKELTVSSTKGLSVGDHVMVYKQGTASKTDGDDEFGSIAEITGINGNTLTFAHSLAFGSDLLSSKQSLADVKVYELDLLENVNVHDFSVRYNITSKDLHNPYNMDVNDILNTTEYNFYTKYAASGKADGTAAYGHHRAMVLSGTHEASIYNIGMEDVGSHAFFFSGNLEMFADNLHVDGTFNKGVDGNGYGIEYDKTYYSDFTNLEITNVRHAVSANMLGGNGFNNFHVKFTDSNLDFHGGRDQANIYYVENIAYKAHYLPIVKDGKLTGDINYGFGKTQFELIDYRQDVNAQENTVVWKNVVANGSPNNDGSILDALGAKLAVNMHSNDDILVAGDNGSNINAGFGNDIIFAGKGNDILTGGRNASGSSNMDTFVFDTKSGHDVITDFEVGHDRLIITHSGSILKGVLEVLSSVSQSGNDTVLDFGNGNSITLMNTHTEDINSTNVQLLSDALDLI